MRIEDLCEVILTNTNVILLNFTEMPPKIEAKYIGGMDGIPSELKIKKVCSITTWGTQMHGRYLEIVYEDEI